MFISFEKLRKSNVFVEIHKDGILIENNTVINGEQFENGINTLVSAARLSTNYHGALAHVVEEAVYSYGMAELIRQCQDTVPNDIGVKKPIFTNRNPRKGI